MNVLKVVSKINVVDLVGNLDKLISEEERRKKLYDRIDEEVWEIYEPMIPAFPGVFKALTECYLYMVSFGHPIIENFIYFQLDNNIIMTVENRDVIDWAKPAIRLLDVKYSYEPEYYTALPFSFRLCSGFKSNFVTYFNKVLREIFTDMSDYPEALGMIFHTLGGIFEGVIGLIPLLERNMVEIAIAEREPIFIFNMKDKLTRDIFNLLRPYASGSRLLGKVHGCGGGLYPFSRIVFKFYDHYTYPLTADRIIEKMNRILVYPRGINEVAFLMPNRLYRDTLFNKFKFTEYMSRMMEEAGLKPEELDPAYVMAHGGYIAWRYLFLYGGDRFMEELKKNPKIDKLTELYFHAFSRKKESREFVKKNMWDPDKFFEPDAYDRRLYIVLHRDKCYDGELDREIKHILDTYVSSEERRMIEKLYRISYRHIHMKEYNEWRNELLKRYPDERDIIEGIPIEEYPDRLPGWFQWFMAGLARRYARKLYDEYWERVREVRDMIMDVSPKREITKFEKELIVGAIGYSYLRLMRMFYTTYGVPILLAEAGYLFKYLMENGFKWKWKDAVKLGLKWMKVKSNRFIGRSMAYYRYREAEEMAMEEWRLGWMRYERHIDEAGRSLEGYRRFGQIHYLEKALQSYRDARRVLTDMLNRYRDREKVEKIGERLTQLNRQINDLEEKLKKLRANQT